MMGCENVARGVEDGLGRGALLRLRASGGLRFAWVVDGPHQYFPGKIQWREAAYAQAPSGAG